MQTQGGGVLIGRSWTISCFVGVELKNERDAMHVCFAYGCGDVRSVE